MSISCGLRTPPSRGKVNANVVPCMACQGLFMGIRLIVLSGAQKWSDRPAAR